MEATWKSRDEMVHLVPCDGVFEIRDDGGYLVATMVPSDETALHQEAIAQAVEVFTATLKAIQNSLCDCA